MCFYCSITKWFYAFFSLWLYTHARVVCMYFSMIQYECHCHNLHSPCMYLAVSVQLWFASCIRIASCLIVQLKMEIKQPMGITMKTTFWNGSRSTLTRFLLFCGTMHSGLRCISLVHCRFHFFIHTSVDCPITRNKCIPVSKDASGWTHVHVVLDTMSPLRKGGSSTKYCFPRPYW